MSERSVPWPEPNGHSHTYPMHCHCGLVRYTITVSPPLYESHTTPTKPERWTAVQCNCSHCERVGAINVHPLYENLEFLQGKEHLVEYRCGGKNNPHWHCGKCGCFLVTDLTEGMRMMGQERRWAVNTRMLQDYDPSLVLVRPVSFMKNVGPKYEV